MVTCGSLERLSKEYAAHARESTLRAEWALSHALKACKKESTAQQEAAIQAAVAETNDAVYTDEDKLAATTMAATAAHSLGSEPMELQGEAL